MAKYIIACRGYYYGHGEWKYNKENADHYSNYRIAKEAAYRIYQATGTHTWVAEDDD